MLHVPDWKCGFITAVLVELMPKKCNVFEQRWNYLIILHEPNLEAIKRLFMWYQMDDEYGNERMIYLIFITISFLLNLSRQEEVGTFKYNILAEKTLAQPLHHVKFFDWKTAFVSSIKKVLNDFIWCRKHMVSTLQGLEHKICCTVFKNIDLNLEVVEQSG